jgi:hypothetical protein
MSICWNGGIIIADTRFESIHGEPAADGYRFKLTVVFSSPGWRHDQLAPVVRLSLASVTAVGANEEAYVGYAIPELTIPFKVYSNSADSRHLHTLILTASAMETIERIRAGQGITLKLKLQGDVWKGHDASPLQETVECRISQSDWLRAIEQSGYGRALLFEVPLPVSDDARAPARYLQQAKMHFVRGHYEEAVGVCRKALEAIKGPSDDQAAAMKLFKGGKDKDLRLDQRELIIRQAVMNYLHPAHHHDGNEDIIRYDRSSASMAMGLVASLLSRIEM